MRALFPSSLLAFALAATFAAAPALAGKNDDAWAQCIWQQVPTSAANWIAMPAPKSSYGLEDPEPAYVLQFRLRAACQERLTPAGKRYPPGFSAKKVRAALITTRPAQVGADQVEPNAYRCDLYFENDTEMKRKAGSDWGYGNPDDKKNFFTMRYFFAGASGRTVGLQEGAGLRRCRIIQSDGTFADA
jgi:hypothetical protein